MTIYTMYLQYLHACIQHKMRQETILGSSYLYDFFLWQIIIHTLTTYLKVTLFHVYITKLWPLVLETPID